MPTFVPGARRAIALSGLTAVFAGPATIALAAGPDEGGPAVLSPVSLSVPAQTAKVIDEHLVAHGDDLRHQVALRSVMRTARHLAEARDKKLPTRYRARLDRQSVGSLRTKQRHLRRDLRELREKQRTGGAPDVAIPAQLAAIASCESGGDPAAIGGGGAFRGKYQFDYGTWASVGGSGDPAAAPEVEQDRRAALLYARSGAAPWPVCGR